MFLGLNIRSLRKNFDELQILNDSLKEPPDIIALTEIFQKIVIKPRTVGKGGGVAAFLKEGISCSLIDYETYQECSILRIKKNKVKGYICSLPTSFSKSG